MNQNPLSLLSPSLFSSQDGDVESNVGTPERPVYVPRATIKFSGAILLNPPVLTGRAAERSVQDRINRDDVEKDENAQFPIHSRRQRRAKARIEARQQRNGQRAYIRRQWELERDVPQSSRRERRAADALSREVQEVYGQ